MALSPNHNRAVGSSLLLAEIRLDELEKRITQKPNAAMYAVIDDMADEQKQIVLRAIKDIKQKILKLHQKYGLRKNTSPLSQILNATYAQLWEVLCDAQVHKLKGFGEFEAKENPQALQRDIQELLDLLEHLKVQGGK